MRDLLSHAVPSGKQEDVLLYALREVRKRHERRRYGSKRKTTVKAPPEAPRPSAGKRYIPVAVRRAADQREARSCAFIGAEGRRCGSTWQLELQHIEPHARGGEPTPPNITELCRPHNLLQAEKDFGADTIAARIAQARAPVDARRGRRLGADQPGLQAEAGGTGGHARGHACAGRQRPPDAAPRGPARAQHLVSRMRQGLPRSWPRAGGRARRRRSAAPSRRRRRRSRRRGTTRRRPPWRAAVPGFATSQTPPRRERTTDDHSPPLEASGGRRRA